MQDLYKVLYFKKKPILVFFLIIFISSIVLADNLVENYNDPITYSNGDLRWCRLYGVCTLGTATIDYLIVYNLSVIGQVFNVTMNLVTWNITTSFNVGGNLIAKNITGKCITLSDGTQFCDSYSAGLWENSTGETKLKSPQDINLQEKNINKVNNITVNDAVIIDSMILNNRSDNGLWSGILHVHSDTIEPLNNLVFVLESNGTTGVHMPHLWIQGGEAGQASGISRSFMIVNEVVALQNTTNLTSCETVQDRLGVPDFQRIDCNTTETGADLLVSDDILVGGDIRITDTQGEYHRLNRLVQVIDEFFNNILFNRINTTIENENLNIVDRFNETLILSLNTVGNNLLVKNDSIALNTGTTTNPAFNYISYQNSANPVLTIDSTTPADTTDHADVVRAYIGANVNEIYLFEDTTSHGFDFVNHVYDRFDDAGAIYISGLGITSSATEINISTGSVRLRIAKTDYSNNVSSGSDFYFVNSTGNFINSSGNTIFDFYSNDADVSNNKYLNIIWGVVPINGSNMRLVAVVQDEPSTEYGSLADAEADEFNTLNFFPNNDNLKKVFIPVARTIIKETASDDFQLLGDDFHLDIRGEVTASGGSPAAPPITDHNELNLLDYASAGHTGFVSTEQLDNGSIIRSPNTSWINDNEIDPIHNLTLDDNLVAWWRMDDISGSAVEDFTGTNDGTLTNGAFQTDKGILGKAVSFDGDNDYIGIDDGTDPSLDFGNFTDFSVSVWIKTTKYPAFIMGSLASGNPNIRWRLLTSATGTLWFNINDGVDNVANTDSVVIADGNWNHIVLVCNRTDNFTTYVNGMFQATASISAIGNLSDLDTLSIGAITTYINFSGQIDDVKILNRTLTAAEVNQTYKLGVLNSETSLDFAYYEEYVSSPYGLFNRLTSFNPVFESNYLLVDEDKFEINYSNDGIEFDGSGTSRWFTDKIGVNEEFIELRDGNICLSTEGGATINIDNSDITMQTAGKVYIDDATITNLDPRNIQFTHTSREEVIRVYTPHACEGIPQTIEFYNIDTGYKEFYYPLLGEFRDSPSEIHKVLHIIEPQFNRNCIPYFRWDKYTGESAQEKKSKNDYQISIPEDKILNQTTGQLQDKISVIKQ